ncbi:MAG TPA: sugar phosphate isomerase/epimerase [Puia sp.]|nr:sugar phosphate isomerase/epimerase [Puia sp.]
MKRRDFVKQSAVLSTASLLLSSEVFGASRLIEKVGIQFFSLPKMLDNDFEGALKMLSNIGYREVELYGPYPFSTDAAKKSWDSVTPSLGFKGSGFFGHTAAEVKALMKQNNLTVPSMHTDLDTLQEGMDQLAVAAHVLGAEFVTLPAIPEAKRKTLDDYKQMADAFNKIGEAAKKAGVKFAYHNHGYGLKVTNGKFPLQFILNGTDPSLVFLEMDLYWTTAGGADPIKLLETYKNRYRLMHVKDMSKKVHFSGDGGDPKQWIELFPYMTTAGNGVIDLKTILPKAKECGVKHFIVEQDMVDHPEIALKKSFDYLASV